MDQPQEMHSLRVDGEQPMRSSSLQEDNNSNRRRRNVPIPTVEPRGENHHAVPVAGTDESSESDDGRRGNRFATKSKRKKDLEKYFPKPIVTTFQPGYRSVGGKAHDSGSASNSSSSSERASRSAMKAHRRAQYLKRRGISSGGGAGDGSKDTPSPLGRDPFSYLRVDVNGVWQVVSQRTTVLVSLLLLQSLSQFILEMYESLISSHVIIPLFLTMLVGAGGNAGNQATVRAITGLVGGEFKPKHFLWVLRKEMICGFLSAVILSLIGFCRVYFLYGTDNLFWSTIAITTSLFAIVVTSIFLGCTLPFLLGRLGFNREHAAPIIQVVMDITGVFITCSLCSVMIPTSEHRSTTHSTQAPVGGGTRTGSAPSL